MNKGNLVSENFTETRYNKVSLNMENSKEEITQSSASMEFHPVTLSDRDVLESYRKIPMTEIAGLGSAFAEMLPEFRTITGTTRINMEGLYRCTYPSGISGHLAKFKDGSGSLGTIVNRNGIAGQARWNRVHSVKSVQQYTVPISPLNMFMAATMIEMNHKLDRIQKLGEEILTYQKAKDRNEQQANFETLLDIYNKFKYNIGNKDWQNLKCNEVQSIKRKTSAQMKLLREQINKSMDKRDLLHTNLQTGQMIRNVQKDFYLYRLAVYMYSFSIFLETLLLGNFSEEYLGIIYKDLNDCSVQYKEYYTEVYNQLERSAQTTIGSGLISSIASVSSGVGKTIHKIPVIEKGPLDEFLMDTGKSVGDFGKNQTDQALSEFRKNRLSGAEPFAEQVREINHLYNSPMDILVDKDAVYLRLETA